MRQLTRKTLSFSPPVYLFLSRPSGSRIATLPDRPFLRSAARRLSLFQRAVILFLIAIGCGAYTACSCGGPGTTVTGGSGPTGGTNDQSETAISVQGTGASQIITVAFNDQTNSSSTITYTPTLRTVYAGASMMGWSYSTDGGNQWTYGGKVAPPPGWSILWGDPAITSSKTNQAVVFLSNLAVPASKYPGAGGVLATISSNGFVDAIGGACIARSSDSGKTFSIYQCVNEPAYDFYDGGSMSSSVNGDIYAGYIDFTQSFIDIWHSPTDHGTFSLLPNPFPGYSASTHPRLRNASDGSLFAAMRDSVGDVLINRFANGKWGAPVVACNNVQQYPVITLSDRILRTGPQFSFDVGPASIIGNDEVRVVCTTQDPRTQRLFLEASFCPFDLSPGCQYAPGWSTSTANNAAYRGDQFNPLVQAGQGSPPVWKVSFLSREDDPTGNKVGVQEGNLAVLPPPGMQRIFLEFDFVTAQTPCPDNRGYWGDYDDLRVTGLVNNSPQFIRAQTNSTAGCTERWDVTSEQVHVSSATSQ